MSSKIVPLHQLMVHEFLLVEANIEQVSDHELKPLIGTGSYSQLRKQLAEMDVVLLRDTPNIPALQFSVPEKKDSFKTVGALNSLNDKKQWMLTPQTSLYLSPTSMVQLEKRAQLANSSIAHAASVSKNSYPLLPTPGYIPEPLVSNENPQAPLRYEYNLEVIGVKHLFGVHVFFNNTGKKGEGRRYAEQVERGRYPDSHIFRIKTSVNEPKMLCAQLAGDNINLINNIPVPKLYAMGSGVVKDTLLFFTPALQMDERLGLAMTGYFYHFHNLRLIQEFHIKGNNRCFFSPTLSTHNHLNSTQYLRKETNAIGIYYRLGNTAVKHQHVIYLSEAITRKQLDNVNEAWLLEHGIEVDVEALFAARHDSVISRYAPASSSQSVHIEAQKHIVKAHSETRERETWSEIAAQYNLSPRELLDFNPGYHDDPMRLTVGDTLLVSPPPQMQEQGVEITEPAAQPKDYQCVANCSYEYQHPNFKTVHDARIAGSNLYPLYPSFLVNEELPVARIQTLQQRTLAIGVFFDGTGQNAKNDEYKENHGDKSRTNIARLFDAYPQEAGKTERIYISGVGTVDMENVDPAMIDEGKDESGLSQALGVELTNLLSRQATWLDSKPALKAVLSEDERKQLVKTSALYKWQSLIQQFQAIVVELTKSGHYQDITHIQFDVFGFSRGAALARHFVNAVLKGIPDYDKPRSGDDELGITPNLLGTESSDAFNPNEGYEVDSSKVVSVRFVGLFDTVGSFYLPGNQDNGQFRLSLKPNCAQKVVQLTAHHEYRHNFPLTSLQVGNNPMPTNFYQEVFPGAHSDVGGGYPWEAQYDKEDLPARYGKPIQGTYNCEEVGSKKQSLQFFALNAQSGYEASSNVENQFKQQQQQWQQESLKEYQQYGLVTLEKDTLHYYRKQPISSALCGLTQERMKQQAEMAGVKWNDDLYHLPKDFAKHPYMQSLSRRLLDKPIGSINVQDWGDEVLPRSKTLIHRPHDAMVHPGLATVMEWLVNRPNKKPDGTLFREIFDNVDA